MKTAIPTFLIAFTCLLSGCSQDASTEQPEAISPKQAIETYLKLATNGDWERLANNYYGKPEEAETVINYFSSPQGGPRAINAFKAALKEDIQTDETGKEATIKFGDNGYLKLVLQEDGTWKFLM